MGARKIMPSAAQREVGEEGEIELLTWGKEDMLREGAKRKKKRLHYCWQAMCNYLRRYSTLKPI